MPGRELPERHDIDRWTGLVGGIVLRRIRSVSNFGRGQNTLFSASDTASLVRRLSKIFQCFANSRVLLCNVQSAIFIDVFC